MPCHVLVIRSDVVTFPRTDVLLCFILVLVFASKDGYVRQSEILEKSEKLLQSSLKNLVFVWIAKCRAFQKHILVLT